MVKFRQSVIYLCKSYVETNKQGLEKDKKNLLNNITPNSNKDYLLYWMDWSQGDYDET